MKYVLRLALPALAVAVLAVACGGDDTDTPDAATSDAAGAHDLSAASDSSSPIDLAGVDFAGVSCGTQTCGASQQCCFSLNSGTQMVEGQCVASGSSCGDGGVPATCDGPEDCTPSASNCCVSLALASGAASGMASCTASCPATASTDNGGSLTTRMCHSPADCTNYSGTVPIIGQGAYDKCCTYEGVSFHFCAPSLLMTVSNKVSCL